MRFWDSSAVVPLLVEENASERMQQLLRDDPILAVWWGSETECVSALARQERSGALDASGARQALARLDLLAAGWLEVQPGDPIRRDARRILRTHDVRAADALQLAAALAVAEGFAETLTCLTLDERLARAAEREGFHLLPGSA
jgi:predicted nucleic acid-binding protein